MIKRIGIAALAAFISSAALAQEPPAYVAPPPPGDAKTTIISGVLMLVNGIIMQEADRRHQECATFVAGLNEDGFPIFRRVCRLHGPPNPN
jgi:hypothetical protein